MTIKLSEINVGDTVIVDRGEPTEVIVLAKHKDVKNGMPGIDYSIKKKRSSYGWAYLSQVSLK